MSEIKLTKYCTNEEQTLLLKSKGLNFPDCTCGGISRWSLSRLISFLPDDVDDCSLEMDKNSLRYMERYCGDEALSERCGFWGEELIDAIVECVAWLIDKGFFPNEYLIGSKIE